MKQKPTHSTRPKEYIWNFKICSCTSWLTLTIYPSSACICHYVASNLWWHTFKISASMKSHPLYFDFLCRYQVTWLSQREVQWSVIHVLHPPYEVWVSLFSSTGHKLSYVNDYTIQNDASQINWFVFWGGRVECRK